MPRPASDKTTINMRISQELLDKLEGRIETGYYGSTDRSSIIQRAVEFLMESRECIDCGTLNSNRGNYCSVCGMRLYSDKEIKELMLCAYKYGLVVTTPAAYENGTEPTSDNKHFKAILELVNDYTSNGLEEIFTPVIDRYYGYNDIRRYRIDVSFKLKDSDMVVLPQKRMEFFIPGVAMEIVMQDQFKKLKAELVGDDDIPSADALEIYTPFTMVHSHDGMDELLAYEELVKERYWDRVIERYGKNTQKVIFSVGRTNDKK